MADFACLEANLILELDGGQHALMTEGDEERTQYVEALGFRVIRFWNIDVLKEWDTVVELIMKALRGASVYPPPYPPPAKPGGG